MGDECGGAPHSLAWDLKARALHSPVSPYRKAFTLVSLVFGQTVCSPGLWLSVFISGRQLSFKIQILWTLMARPMLFLPLGGRRVSLCFCLRRAPARRATAWPWSGSQFMAMQSQKPALRLTVFSWLPRSEAWEYRRPQTPPLPFFLWPWGPWGHAARDASLLCHLRTFKPGISPTVADLQKFWFGASLFIIICGSLLRPAQSNINFALAYFWY